MLRLGVLSASVAVLSAAGQGGTTAPAPYKGRIIRPVVKVFGANPVRTGVSTNDYWDDGADCSDHVPFDMDLNFHVAAGGDVVRLDKPGKYTIKYYCTNDRGMSAVPKTRTVIVANRDDRTPVRTNCCLGRKLARRFMTTAILSA